MRGRLGCVGDSDAWATARDVGGPGASSLHVRSSSTLYKIQYNTVRTQQSSVSPTRHSFSTLYRRWPPRDSWPPRDGAAAQGVAGHVARYCMLCTSHVARRRPRARPGRLAGLGRLGAARAARLAGHSRYTGPPTHVPGYFSPPACRRCGAAPSDASGDATSPWPSQVALLTGAVAGARRLLAAGRGAGPGPRHRAGRQLADRAVAGVCVCGAGGRGLPSLESAASGDSLDRECRSVRYRRIPRGRDPEARGAAPGMSLRRCSWHPEALMQSAHGPAR